MAAYDAALTACGLEQYNLVTVSSVLPPDATVERVEMVPSIGSVGSLVPVVQARGTVTAPGSAGVAIAWSAGPEGGVVFEADASGAPGGEPAVDAESEALTGIEAGIESREWALPDPAVASTSITPPADMVGVAVAVAVLDGAALLS